MILPALYRGLTAAATPLAVIYLKARRRRGKEDNLRFAERLGVPGFHRPDGPLIWMHAASIGEATSVLALIERLLQERPALEILITTGTVTAGTSSPLTDGASAVLVTSEAYARAHGLPILARVIGTAISGCSPDIMGIGPVESSRKALARAGITVADLDVIELNEAFASQALACIADLGLDPAKINLDGGAIALGHPLGATGARIVGKAASLLKRTGGRYALATQCIGGGQGIATVLEAV